MPKKEDTLIEHEFENNMKCQSCHRNVTKKTNFCPHCGSKIVPRKSKKQISEGSGFSTKHAVLFIAVGILAGAGIIKMTENSEANVHDSPTGIQTSVTDIAKEFQCFCGICDHRLDECDCEHDNGSLEVKGFILQQLQEGHKKPHIMEMVQATFGQSAPTVPALPLVPTEKFR